MQKTSLNQTEWPINTPALGLTYISGRPTEGNPRHTGFKEENWVNLLGFNRKMSFEGVRVATCCTKDALIFRLNRLDDARILILNLVSVQQKPLQHFWHANARMHLHPSLIRWLKVTDDIISGHTNTPKKNKQKKELVWIAKSFGQTCKPSTGWLEEIQCICSKPSIRNLLRTMERVFLGQSLRVTLTSQMTWIKTDRKKKEI